MSLQVRFLNNSTPDAALSVDIHLLSSFDITSFFDVSLGFLSGDDAARIEAALDNVVAINNGLKIAVAKRLARSLTIAIGGAVKNGLNGAQLAADLILLGESLLV